ncbi:MAG: DUF1003 domain-containing protein [Armatimonadetes bacterium]|nr:DUF1003 domain-containing protein [Armatimonadota bacterium]
MGTVNSVVQQNIVELYEHRRRHNDAMTAYEKVANGIAVYCGKPSFVFLNAVFFTVWIALNVNLFALKPFDPYPFGLLTTIVSLEAIFLSLFVLLSQNRMQELSDRQNELDLQVNLLTERELTKVLVALDAIAEKLGVPLSEDPEFVELQGQVTPTEVLEEIERAQQSQPDKT